jgi:ACT domain-containing protein
MSFKKSVGRPTKIDIRTSSKLADALRNNYSVTDACKWAKISRDTFYRHMNNDMAFAAKMNYAIESRNKVSFNFRTTPWLN